MIENFQFTIETIAFLSGLIGLVLLYFGKVIGDTKVEKYNKLDFYIEGLFFSLVYVFIPFIAGYYFFINGWMKFPNWAYILLQILILGCLSWNFIAHNFLRKFDLIDEFKKRSNKKIEDLRNQKLAIRNFISKEREDWFKNKFGFDFIQLNILALYDIPIKIFGNKKILLLFSFLTFLSIFYTVSNNFILSAFSFVMSFFIITMVALAYGFGDSYYPPSTILLDNGKEVKGNIIKFSDEFIFILSGDKKIFVNKDRVVKIEQSLWKEVKK
ncbi:MAG: hypothetical protein ACPLXC_03510 [Candidatus Pacearchaeota archaeon]